MEDKQIHEKGYLNTAQAADMLGLSPKTLCTWRALDKGPKFYKFNRAVVYKVEDLEAWISEHYKLVVPKN